MDPLLIEHPDNDSPAPSRTLRINGRPAREELGSFLRDKPSISVEDQELRRILEGYPLAELQRKLWAVALRPNSGVSEIFEQTKILFYKIEFHDVETGSEEFKQSTAKTIALDLPVLTFRLASELTDWAYPWTPREFINAARRATEKRANAGLTFSGLQGLDFIAALSEKSSGFDFDCVVRSLDHSLGDEISHWSNIVRSINEEAIAHLLAAQHADALTTTFHFPPAIATACEQYLLYFVQFLADLGIEAQAEVQHTAAEVLFRVTPNDGREALERVREALDAYLQLPVDPSVALVPSSGQDPAVWELKAVIRHLKDRVELQQDVLEARNERILAQAERIQGLQLANYQLQQQAGGEVKSLEPGGAQSSTTGGEETESVIQGALSVKRYEIGPIIIEVPKILRMLKRRF